MTAHRSDRKGVTPPRESGEACPWACVSPRKTSVHRRHGHPDHRRLSSAPPPRVRRTSSYNCYITRRHRPPLLWIVQNALTIVSIFMLNILDGIDQTLQVHFHGY